MARVEFDDQPLQAYAELERTGRAQLLDAIDDAVDALEADPGDKRCRERNFRDGRWGITVRDQYDSWLIIWQQAEDDLIVVRYLGLDPFALSDARRAMSRRAARVSKMIGMTDIPRRGGPQRFNRRTVKLLVSIDPYLSASDGSEYVTRESKLLGRVATRRIRRASSTDIAQAKLIRAGMRDPALARYEDKARLYFLMSPHVRSPRGESLTVILARMTDADRAMTQDIIGRVRPGGDPGVPTGNALTAEHLKLGRIEHQARALAESSTAPEAADQVALLADLVTLRCRFLSGHPEWGVTVTADEAAAKLDDLKERYPAGPIA